MANITQAECQRLLDASNGTAGYVNPTAPVKARLATTTPTSTAAGTEVVGGSYAAQTVAQIPATPATPATSSNSAVLTYANMPAVTVSAVDEFDSAGTPFRRWFGNLTTPRALSAGDTFSIAAGSYSKSLG